LAVPNEPILIVGGGLGGLTTALALAQRGMRARVLEGAPEFGAIGYGIQFGPNIFHVLDRIGLSERVLQDADCPPAVMMVDACTGNEVTRVPTGESFRRRFKYPYIIIHRIDLHMALLEAAKASDGIELVPQAMVTGYRDHGDRVTVATEDGREFSGAALVAADGVRSCIRTQLIGDGEPRSVGFLAHRTIVPMAGVDADVHRDRVVLWGGPGFHIVHYPLRHGTLFNIVAVFRTSAYAERADIDGRRAELARIYASAHPAMHALLAMMDLGRRFGVADREPIRQWHRNRVVLLGDAAHPTLQSLAQGACMAIEDGLCLAELIAAANGDFELAFRSFAAGRYLRTARVTLESRHLWEVYHSEGIAREVFWQALGERSEADVFQCLAWLYDGFPFEGAR
jgi:salicylate hydroxylase